MVLIQLKGQREREKDFFLVRENLTIKVEIKKKKLCWGFFFNFSYYFYVLRQNKTKTKESGILKNEGKLKNNL